MQEGDYRRDFGKFGELGYAFNGRCIRSRFRGQMMELERLYLVKDGDVDDFVERAADDYSFALGWEGFYTLPNKTRIEIPEKEIEKNPLIYLSNSFHEIGHSQDFTKKIKEGVNLDKAYNAAKDSQFWVEFDDLMLYIDHEHKAWEYALTEIKNKDITAEELDDVKEDLLENLMTYYEFCIGKKEPHKALQYINKRTGRTIDDMVDEMSDSLHSWREIWDI